MVDYIITHWPAVLSRFGLLWLALSRFVPYTVAIHPGLHGLTVGAFMPQYLTKPQAAQFLGVSTRTLTRWLASPNPPPSVQFGERGHRRYDRDALAAWVAQQGSQPQQVTA